MKCMKEHISQPMSEEPLIVDAPKALTTISPLLAFKEKINIFRFLFRGYILVKSAKNRLSDGVLEHEPFYFAFMMITKPRWTLGAANLSWRPLAAFLLRISSSRLIIACPSPACSHANHAHHCATVQAPFSSLSMLGTSKR